MSDLQVYVLASGSQGNASLVVHGDQCFLIDAGISARRITQGIKSLGIPMSALQGIILTHEHGDHMAGVTQMIKQYDVPIYTRAKTADELIYRDKLKKENCVYVGQAPFELAGVSVSPFSTSHDVVDPIGVSCIAGSDKLTFITDTGIITNEMMYHLEDSNLLVLEANYDAHMLKYGPYPSDLKRRVGGKTGHLCNDDTYQTILNMKRPKEMHIVLAHRSEKNNAIPIVDFMVDDLQKAIKATSDDVLHIRQGQPKEIITLRD